LCTESNRGLRKHQGFWDNGYDVAFTSSKSKAFWDVGKKEANHFFPNEAKTGSSNLPRPIKPFLFQKRKPLGKEKQLKNN